MAERTDVTDPGQSTTTPGEDKRDEDGKEAGRVDTGAKGASDRPTGTSTARDTTSVDPQEPVTGSPPMGGQGG